MATEVRAVGADAFDEILPLLREFPTKHMTRDDWWHMLFAYPWSVVPQRGFAMYVDGRAVGFLATIFSDRELAGKMERVCSLSSWIVLPEHRDASLKLVTPILRMRGCTILNPTPSPVAYGIFQKLGFLPLESERLIFFPMSGAAVAARSLGARFSTSPAVIERDLRGRDRAIYADLSKCPAAKHVLLRHGGEQCYVVATAAHKRFIPFAEIQYASSMDFFWKHRLLAHAALFPSTRATGLWVDKRFARGRARLALHWPAPRLYRPTRKEITPEMIDGLYSELMGLHW